MTKLIHITSPEQAIKIFHLGAYITSKEVNSYDAGMNFIGILGESPNTQPTGRGAKMYCEWNGPLSEPVPFDEHDCHTPNILFDFNGSGGHYRNNDPRYFLPAKSSGLILKRIELDKDYDQDSFIEWWWVVFKILCHFDKLHEKEMTHDQTNLRYGSGLSAIA